ncbi:hypothetical protein [Nostoc flagelliforme]|uniref:hypothetical protein n=1 Tax=Nostoc flagelliforme TaxID=1306274 RepID=UPI000C2D09BF|nr:hypothetical protein [Nostoc flagelliforme]
MPTSSSNLWKTQIGSFELTAIHTDDSGEIMIRQEDFILKPANDLCSFSHPKVVRMGVPILFTNSLWERTPRAIARYIALINRMRVATLDTSQSDHFLFFLLRVIER